MTVLLADFSPLYLLPAVGCPAVALIAIAAAIVLAGMRLTKWLRKKDAARQDRSP